jgi:hypothetical protein
MRTACDVVLVARLVMVAMTPLPSLISMRLRRIKQYQQWLVN